MTQCKLYIEILAPNFPTDKTKASFIISLLKGQVAKWATPLLTVPSLLLADSQGFLLHLTSAFGNPVQMATANWKIWTLKQGKSSMAKYSTEFQQLPQDFRWNKATLKDQFVEGLSDNVQTELAQVECPTTIHVLIIFCLHIDGHLESRHQAPSHHPATIPSQPVQAGSLPIPSGTHDDSEPMQLGQSGPGCHLRKICTART